MVKIVKVSDSQMQRLWVQALSEIIDMFPLLNDASILVSPGMLMIEWYIDLFHNGT